MGDVVDFKQKTVIAGPKYDKQEMVKEFNEAFSTSKDPQLWLKLIQEEVAEVAEAAAHLLKELADLQYVIIGGTMAGLDMIDATTVDNIENLEKWRKAVPEHIMEEVFRRVHASNMSKLGADGKPMYRADGKVIKGPDYQEPYLFDLV